MVRGRHGWGRHAAGEFADLTAHLRQRPGYSSSKRPGRRPCRRTHVDAAAGRAGWRPASLLRRCGRPMACLPQPQFPDRTVKAARPATRSVLAAPWAAREQAASRRRGASCVGNLPRPVARRWAKSARGHRFALVATNPPFAIEKGLSWSRRRSNSLVETTVFTLPPLLASRGQCLTILASLPLMRPEGAETRAPKRGRRPMAARLHVRGMRASWLGFRV